MSGHSPLRPPARSRVVPAAILALITVTARDAGAQSFRGLGFLDPDASPPGSFATGVSADGSIVVGSSYFFDGEVTGLRAFRWTEAEGLFDLGLPANGMDSCGGSRVSAGGSVVVGNNGFTVEGFYEPRNGVIWTRADTGSPDATVFGEMYFANDVSADGSIVIGATRLPVQWPAYDQMFRWTAENGIVEFGMLPDGTYSAGTATSADGSVIVGFGDNYDSVTAIRWTEGKGIRELAGIAPDVPSEARGVTPDGTVIVGRAANEAFWWSEDSGLRVIGQLPGASWSYANDVSADASVIVGYSDFQSSSAASIWTPTDGLRDLKEVLESDYGLDLGEWSLRWATGVSDDGRTIVGVGVNPSGLPEAFVVTLGSPCPADLDGSGDVGFGDILAVLAAWGNAGGPEDLDGSGFVDFGDLLIVLASWGQCALPA